MRPKAIMIGASAGGITAIQNVFSMLRENFQTPIVVTQHLPSDATIDPQLIFGASFRGPCIEAHDKTPLEPHTAYFAPPGYHLMIERDLTLSLSQDEPVLFARPSIDVLFESGAYALGHRACAVLLTGANADGAQGIHVVHKNRGMTIIQDPDTAEVAYMPLMALELTKPTHVLPLPEIASRLNRLDEEE